MFATRFHLAPNMGWFGLPEILPQNHAAPRKFEDSRS